MIVTRATDLYPISLPSSDGRPRGLHVSAIIRHIAVKYGILDAKWVEELSLADVRTITDPTSILRINIGLGWEEQYIPLLDGVLKHPGTMCVDGIYMTHDGESLSTVRSERGRSHYVIACHEIKSTYKSLRNVEAEGIDKQWMWMAQVMAYCKGLMARIAYIHVLYLCGDYTYPIRPVREVYKVEFTPEEIAMNWNMIVNYAKENAA